ncbi:glutathione S-transferase-like protein [Mycena belliarum]|uniref:Glutathione S-transferase-like protein n=1 Tax=Mycena belliarum TaxID=1033014 RepID=A0AAD6UI25_9AGAR|nr:glutathione S-transferase-like protein [Mycena belliae]
MATTIFPHATGAALATAEAHKDPQDLIFYSGWFCPYNQRVWVTLEEKGIPYQYQEVNPYKKEQRFLDVNPKGLVPTVEVDGKALYESLVLCEFLEDAYPDRKPSMFPGDAYTKGHVRLWVDFVQKSFVPTYVRLLQAKEQDKQEPARKEMIEALRTFTAEIKGPYFLGEEFSLVDVAIAPWIQRDDVMIEHRGYTREAVSAEWKRYADHVVQRESVVKTKSDKEKYDPLYARFL